MAENNSQLPENTDKLKRFIDVQTDKRIHEHLTDENDEISEADIGNIRTDIGKTDEVVITEQNEDGVVVPPATDEEDAKEEKVKDNSDPNIGTSWNILGS